MDTKPPQPPLQTTQSPEPPSVSTPETEPTLNNSRKKLFLIAGVMVVLILGSVAADVLVRHHDQSATVSSSDPINRNHPEDHTYETVVSLTGSGFVPATTTVKPATEVFFDNNVTNAEGEVGSSVRIMQSKAAANQATYFASDPIAGNSEYGYTFRTKGTYQFYDADTPAHTLTIVVK